MNALPCVLPKIMNLPSWVRLTAAWYSDPAHASRAFISSLILKLLTGRVRYSTYSITLVTTPTSGVPHRHACILPARSEHRNGNRQMRRILNQAANAAVKRKGSIFEILYRRLVPRLGHNKTIWPLHTACAS